MKSWKTSLAGLLQFLALAGQQFAFLFDNIPTTEPDWNLVIASALTLFGLLTARDNDVSSETAGAE